MSSDDMPDLENIERERVCGVYGASFSQLSDVPFSQLCNVPFSQICECSKPAQNSPELEKWRKKHRAVKKMQKKIERLERLERRESEFRRGPARTGQPFQFDVMSSERMDIEDEFITIYGDILKQVSEDIADTISSENIGPELLKKHWKYQ